MRTRSRNGWRRQAFGCRNPRRSRPSRGRSLSMEYCLPLLTAALSLPFRWPFYCPTTALSLPVHCPFTAVSLSALACAALRPAGGCEPGRTKPRPLTATRRCPDEEVPARRRHRPCQDVRPGDFPHTSTIPMYPYCSCKLTGQRVGQGNYAAPFPKAHRFGPGASVSSDHGARQMAWHQSARCAHPPTPWTALQNHGLNHLGLRPSSPRGVAPRVPLRTK